MNKFNKYFYFNTDKGQGLYLEGWTDAHRNILHLIEHGYDLDEIERFCKRENYG